MRTPPSSFVRLGLAAVTVCGAGALITAAVSPQRESASVSGTVISAATNRPVANASVSLFPERSDAGQGERTDARGRFTFSQVAPGRYWLSADASGYLRMSFGAAPGLRPTPIAVGGDEKTGFVLALHRGSSLSGTVVDDSREPVVGIGVRAFVRRYVDGIARYAPVGVAETDDRGAFRIFGLDAGRYIVAATNVRRGNRGSPPFLGPDAVVTTFAPSTTDPSAATAYTLGVDEEKAGVAIRTQNVRAGIIDGHVTGPGAPAIPGLTVSLIAEPELLVTIPVNERPQPGGRFTFTNVAPGRYSLVARSAADPGVSRVWGVTPVIVTPGATIPASIALRDDGAQVTGEVEASGAVGTNSFGLAPVAGGHAASVGVRPTLDGRRFTMDRIPPGTYKWTGGFVLAGVAPLVTVAIGGRDASDVPLVLTADSRIKDVRVTISDRWSTIEGRVTEPSGHATSAGAIVVFSSSEQDWTPASRRVRDTRADTTGRYEVPGLPPGEYFVAAVPRVEPGQVFDPSFLKAISGRIRVAVGPGETETVDIRLPPKFQDSASKHRPER